MGTSSLPTSVKVHFRNSKSKFFLQRYDRKTEIFETPEIAFFRFHSLNIDTHNLQKMTLLCFGTQNPRQAFRCCLSFWSLAIPTGGVLHLHTFGGGAETIFEKLLY